MRILIKPIITEKTLQLAELKNQYTFDIVKTANKIEVRKSVELKFGVRVISVMTHRRLGKKVSFGKKRISGQKSSVKRAIVTLKPGDNIGIFKLK